MIDSVLSKETDHKAKAKPLPRKELEYFKKLLLEKRLSILGDVHELKAEINGNFDSHNSNRPDDVDDVAGFSTDHYELDVAARLLASEHNLLREINEALDRIENGTYGICEGTGIRIHKNRLKAIPWARHCIEYASEMQKQFCVKR